MNETKCDIIFVNSVGTTESVYYSGQKITGSVVISIYDKLEIKGKRIMNHSHATYCHWEKKKIYSISQLLRKLL